MTSNVEDKIRKLLALAESTDSPGEAANARAMAEKLRKAHPLPQKTPGKLPDPVGIIKPKRAHFQGGSYDWPPKR